MESTCGRGMQRPHSGMWRPHEEGDVRGDAQTTRGERWQQSCGGDRREQIWGSAQSPHAKGDVGNTWRGTQKAHMWGWGVEADTESTGLEWGHAQRPD